MAYPQTNKDFTILKDKGLTVSISRLGVIYQHSDAFNVIQKAIDAISKDAGGSI